MPAHDVKLSDPHAENAVMMHSSAKVVLMQPHKKGIELYVLVEGENGFPADEEMALRRFAVVRTGQSTSEPAVFVATVTLPSCKALHVFELP